jgi:hypothetical protein
MIPWFQIELLDFIFIPAECLQCYCGEILQMLTFLTSLYCPKAYDRPDHSIRNVEYHRKIIIIIIILKPNIFTETQTQDSFSGLWPLFLQPSRRKINIVLGDIFLLCIVFKMHKPPSTGFEPIILFRSFDFSKISSGF